MGELCAEELVVQVGGGEWWSDGGHRGAMPIGGGAVFQCQTLVWVVRNIPQKNRHYTHQWTRLSCDTSFRS